MGECVCDVNTEIHREWKARSTIRARRRQTKEDAFIAVVLVGSKRPNRLETDVFAPKDGKPKVKADADILLEQAAVEAAGEGAVNGTRTGSSED
eukprot:COSAG05_NODE_7848_length_763_cov_1.638554_1_plen_93_part_10